MKKLTLSLCFASLGLLSACSGESDTNTSASTDATTLRTFSSRANQVTTNTSIVSSSSDPNAVQAPTQPNEVATNTQQPPIAKISYSANINTIKVDAGESRSANNDELASYAWDFGDGTTGEGKRATHTYSNDGVYTVQLTVTDSQGLKTSTTTAVSAPMMRTGFEDGTLSPLYGCATHSGHMLHAANLIADGITPTDYSGESAMKTSWRKNSVRTEGKADRGETGPDACNREFGSTKEIWYGFNLYIPDEGYPIDRYQGIVWFHPNGGATSSMIQIMGSSLILAHRGKNGGERFETILENIPRGQWIPIVVHMVGSAKKEGIITAWIGDVDEAHPTVDRQNIQLGNFQNWDAATDSILDNKMIMSFGQYNYDAYHEEGRAKISEPTRTTYIDNLTVIQNPNHPHPWLAVHPKKSGFFYSGESAANSDNTPGRTAINAIHEAGDRWQVNNVNPSSPAWMQYRLSDGKARTLTSYTLHSAHPPGSPKVWQLLGSNDGKEWNVLDSKKDILNYAGAPYSIANPAPYLYYRLNVEQVRSGTSIHLRWLQLNFAQ